LIIFAVRAVVFFIILNQIRQSVPVMRGDKVDARLRTLSVPLI
jgi:hypothetical protein